MDNPQQTGNVRGHESWAARYLFVGQIPAVDAKIDSQVLLVFDCAITAVIEGRTETRVKLGRRASVPVVNPKIPPAFERVGHVLAVVVGERRQDIINDDTGYRPLQKRRFLLLTAKMETTDWGCSRCEKGINAAVFRTAGNDSFCPSYPARWTGKVDLSRLYYLPRFRSVFKTKSR